MKPIKGTWLEGEERIPVTIVAFISTGAVVLREDNDTPFVVALYDLKIVRDNMFLGVGKGVKRVIIYEDE